jgi:hypothetical protein
MSIVLLVFPVVPVVNATVILRTDEANLVYYYKLNLIKGYHWTNSALEETHVRPVITPKYYSFQLIKSDEPAYSRVPNPTEPVRRLDYIHLCIGAHRTRSSYGFRWHLYNFLPNVYITLHFTLPIVCSKWR